MGEALISRAGGNGDIETISPDIGIFLFTLTDSDNNPISNVYVNCNDAGTFYNYSTNSKGQVIYPSLKSGFANLQITAGYSNNVKFADQISAGWYNIECPLGKNTKATRKFTRATTMSISNGNYSFLVANKVNLNMAGGVGGDGGRYTIYRNDYSKWDYYIGGNGGGANQLIKNSISINKNTVYKAIVGKNGVAGSSGYWDFRSSKQSYQDGTNGTSGGTSSFLGYSAAGGAGGNRATFSGNGVNGTSYGSWRLSGYISISIIE